MKFLFKFTLFRIIFNLPLGIIGIEIFHNIFFHKGIWVNISNQGFQLSENLFMTGNCLGTFFYIIISILAGEIFALIGEGILNPFFDYNPIVNDYIEKISYNEEQKIFYEYYNNFIKNAGEALKELSEIHFVMSRIISGSGFLSIISVIAFNFNTAGFCFILLPIIIIFIICVKCLKQNNSFVCFVMIILFIPSIFFGKFKKITINIFLIFLGIFLICSAINYRAHANRIINS